MVNPNFVEALEHAGPTDLNSRKRKILPHKTNVWNLRECGVRLRFWLR